MIWEAGIALVILGYMVRYWREGITHPIPLLWAYWLVMLPMKYFGFRYLGVPFTGAVPLHVVDEGSMYLFFFMAGTVLAHAFFSRVRLNFPLVEAVPRVGLALPSLGLVAATLGLAVAQGGAGILRNSLKLRALAETGPGAYISIFLTFTMIAATVSLASRRQKLPLIIFAVLLTAYFLVMARAGLIVFLATTYLSYLCMVERVVPIRSLTLGVSVLAPVALAQGILRQAGGYTEKAFHTIWRLTHSDTAIHFAASAFGSRVNQLEAFSVFLDDLEKGIIKHDPLSPLYLFSQVVPRSVWPDKPEMFADQMTGVIAPRSHAIHVVYNFLGPAELMFAFGIIAGLILTCIIYGYFFAVIDRYYVFCRGRPGAYLFLALTVLAFLGAGSESGFFNSIALLQLLVFSVAMAALFKLKLHAPPSAEKVPPPTPLANPSPAE
ncbi:MAG TPA: hypothetical protein VMU22_09150 [Rhizomicrobium sp.]|nr:hypothetical protein [Rhizomicrobium sp.]